MAKIKFTKTELKGQRDALARFSRYLPTLQLKKQQLQAEVRRLQAEAEAKRREETRLRKEAEPWLALFAETPEPVDPAAYLELTEARIRQGNVVGVRVPVLDEVVFDRTRPDPFATPPWLDQGLDLLQDLVRLRLEGAVLDEQARLLDEELRTTTQRVNLFEKVKIPECKENIRMIRIALGDEQTAAVARAKIAKAKHAEDVTAA